METIRRSAGAGHARPGTWLCREFLRWHCSHLQLSFALELRCVSTPQGFPLSVKDASRLPVSAQSTVIFRKCAAALDKSFRAAYFPNRSSLLVRRKTSGPGWTWQLSLASSLFGTRPETSCQNHVNRPL